ELCGLEIWFRERKQSGGPVLLCSPHYWLPDLMPDPDPSSPILLLYPDRFKHCDETGLLLMFFLFLFSHPSILSYLLIS
uniref:Uncharacterized protein n=1 Tax=Cercocebus atys TaxID=9531 RepID=A0A2K5MQV6_CERAT